MSNIRLIAFLFCVVVAGAGASFPRIVLAVGISPALLEVNNVTSNSSVKKNVVFSRANPSVDLEARVSVSGNGAAAIRLTDKGKTVLPKGAEQVPYEFAIEPKRFVPGTYEVNLKVVPEDVNKEGESGTKVLSGAESIVRFTVTREDVKSYQVSNAKALDIKENETVSFTYIMTNDGNVDARPSRVEISLANEFDKEKVYSVTIQESELPITKPFTEETMNVDTEIALPLGLYSASIRFFRENENIYSTESIRMQVTNENGEIPDSVMQKGKNARESFLLAFGSLLGLLFFVLAFAAVRQRRKR